MMSIIKGFSIALSLLMSGAAIADNLELSCSGERYNHTLKKYYPYNFTASIDLEANKISIRQGEHVYREGNANWNKETCPNQEWLTKITGESFKARSICHNLNGNKNWQINRADGSFHVSSYHIDTRLSSAKGGCVKATDKAF